MTIKENICLADYTSFKIGGPARYFLIVENIDDLIEAMDFVRQKNLPYFILGGGSNLLVNDEGYRGIITKITNSKLQITNKSQIQNSKFKIIKVGAGVGLKDLIDYSVKNNLTGLEWAAGIPGTVGGAIRGNAGAFGKCIADNINGVCCLSCPKVKNYNNSDCKFSYRDSIFKHNKDIIISAEIKLKKGDRQKIGELISQNLKTRKQKHPLEYPSAGCVFQNVSLLSLRARAERGRGNPVENDSYSSGLLRFVHNDKIPAANLIEQCGLKGKQIGQAMISKKHTNFIVNLGKAKSQDVLKLIELIKREVKNKFKIDLKEEIEYLGFD